MSEEGVEDVIEGLLRQSMTAATQLGEQLARARQQFLRKAEQQSEQQHIEAQRAMAADRAAMRAVVVPATQDAWWESADARAITQAHLLAEAWKGQDPEALAAAEKITAEVKQRYGIDTADMQGDGVYMQDRLAAQQIAEQQLRLAKENAEAMALVAAAQAEEIKKRASALHEQIERHQVPRDYLSNAELVAALQSAKEAVGTDAAPDAERAVAERMHLIEKDGIDGPNIEDLRQEISQNYPGVEDSHFADAEFVAAARDWHEAKILAEAGFEAKGDMGLQGRYEGAEKEFFAKLAPMGKDIENKVLADRTTRAAEGTNALAESEPKVGPSFGSKDNYDAFEASLKGMASDTDIKGRVAAARGQATHPSTAAKVPSRTPKARKAGVGLSVGRERTNEGPSR